MEGDFIKVNDYLLPLSWLYGCGVRIRNFCFDVGILKSSAFHVPVIAVGNITVGGTGKTPHVEYLVRLLQQRFSVAVLSRGYKRKTSGFILADTTTSVRDIGDEPLQMKRKFPAATIAVDKKRVDGIRRLIESEPTPDVILLDDAFQHRYVKPGINILLVDYHRLIIYDKLLPAGRLREPLNGKNRADIVIITKCPKELKPMEFRVITKAMNLFPYQHLYFTRLAYDELQPLYSAQPLTLSELPAINTLLLTGIASPRQMKEDLQEIIADSSTTTPTGTISTITFPDHHTFTQKDVERINNAFAAMPSPKIVITTEKDAVRLDDAIGLSDELRQHLYVLPVRIQFMQQGQEEKFAEHIMGYVVKNSRNSTLTKAVTEHKARKDAPSRDKPKTISFK